MRAITVCYFQPSVRDYRLSSLTRRRQQSYSISLSKAIIDGDMSSVSQGFQKAAESRNISLFRVSAFRDLKAQLSCKQIVLGEQHLSAKKPLSITGSGCHLFESRGIVFVFYCQYVLTNTLHRQSFLPKTRSISCLCF